MTAITWSVRKVDLRVDTVAREASTAMARKPAYVMLIAGFDYLLPQGSRLP